MPDWPQEDPFSSSVGATTLGGFWPASQEDPENFI